MKEFLFIFRRDVVNNEPALSPEQLQSMMKPWQDWIGNIAAQNKLVDSGNRLTSDGRVVKSGSVITNGPFVELKEAVGGYTIVKANAIEEATELSLGCPILKIGGSVEVREIIQMNNN